MKRNRKVKTEITTPENVTFIKQVPLHSSDRLKTKKESKVRELQQSN